MALDVHVGSLTRYYASGWAPPPPPPYRIAHADAAVEQCQDFASLSDQPFWHGARR